MYETLNSHTTQRFSWNSKWLPVH